MKLFSKLRFQLVNSRFYLPSIPNQYFRFSEVNAQVKPDIVPKKKQIPEKKTDFKKSVTPVIPEKHVPEWGHFFFDKSKTIKFPVVDLEKNLFLKRTEVELPHSIFNNLIRRDLIHKVYLYNLNFNLRTFRWTKGKGMVAGSGKKPHPQKKTGRARQGCKRAAQLKKGGHVFPLKPKSYYFPLNKKIRLLGLKSMLTSMLIEKRIIIVDKISKNRLIFKKLMNVVDNHKSILLVEKDEESEFKKKKLEQKNLSIKPLSIRSLNVKELLSHKFLVFTMDSLKQFCEEIEEREKNYYRLTKKFKSDPSLKRNPTQEFQFDFDPNAELIVHTPSLKGSLDTILKYESDPQLMKDYVQKRWDQSANDKNKIKQDISAERKRIAEERMEINARNRRKTSAKGSPKAKAKAKVAKAK